MFFSLSKVLFSGFLQFKGDFVDGQNNSKYRDVAPLRRGEEQDREEGEMAQIKLGGGRNRGKK